MTQARKTQIDPSTTPYYHCITRCVRRAYLCGEDELTGRSYNHRKQWVVDKLKQLADIFTIDICAYAVMSNHYHVVLHINAAAAQALTEVEVAQRWRSLFNGNVLVQRWLNGELLGEAEYRVVSDTLAQWRDRLMDISWFMRCLNENIARHANKEDECKGRFWESRFKSQALLDESALLSCMMYVDLNPVRAGVVDNLSDSDFTSIQQRLRDQAQKKPSVSEPELVPFQALHIDEPQLMQAVAIPFAFADYCELIDWTGRAIRNDKPGAIPSDIPRLLQQLSMPPEQWLDGVQYFESRFPRMAGRIERLKQVARCWGRCWFQGVGRAFNCATVQEH